MRASGRFAMAVHVLALLGFRDGQPTTSRYLASSVNTNPVIIRRLLLALQKAKLVETRKGAGRGSRLSRPLSEITLAEVYHSVEDEAPFALPSRKTNPACPVGSSIELALETIFFAAQDALQRELARLTLEDVLDLVMGSTYETRQQVA